VSNPRFEPRAFTNEPDAFGLARAISWRDADSDHVDQANAARLQHLWALAIRAASKKQFGSVKAYSVAAQQNYDRLAKVLRGDTIMRLEDIAAAQRLLKIPSFWREDDLDS
jgi:hypothetical protein